MWILYSLLAVILWSSVNIIDGYLVDKNKKIGHPIGALVLFACAVAVVVTAGIGIFTPGLFGLALWQIVTLLATGLLNISWIILYLYALTDEDVSATVPWFMMIPVFGYILGYFILGETILPAQLFGGAIILFGGIILSVRLTDGKYHIKYRTALFMILASFFVALWGVLFKLVASDQGFWVSTFWEHAGLALSGVLILIFVRSYREGFREMLHRGKGTIIAANSFAEVLSIGGNLLNNLSLLLAPVMLVYLVGAFQPAVAFIMGLLCTLYAPYFYKEDISKKTLVHKIISIAIMTIGAIIVLV